MRRHLLGAAVLGSILILAAGCGRPVIPGQQFKGQQAQTSSQKPVTSPLPKEPFFEEGAKDARVRVIAFYPIDTEHKQLMDLLKSFAKEYPGKVYVKYIDYRTPVGQQAFTNAKMTVQGVLINSKKEFIIKAKPADYPVDLSQDMGRYWTADDLKKAVAQEVAAAYGKGAAAGK